MTNDARTEYRVKLIDEYRATQHAHLIAENSRADALAGAFGTTACVHVEAYIFRMADELLPAYQGGFWDFIRLKDGGFYMALDPRDSYQCQVAGNGYHGELSGDAAGIVCCMMVYSHMSFVAKGRLQELLTKHFHWVREYVANGHPEARKIFAAID